MVVRCRSPHNEDEVEVDCGLLTDNSSLVAPTRILSVSYNDEGDSDKESEGSGSSHSTDDASEHLSDPLCMEIVDRELDFCAAVVCKDICDAALVGDDLVEYLPPEAEGRVRSRRVACYALLGMWMLVGCGGHRLFHAREEHVFDLIQRTSDAQVEAQDKIMDSEVRIKVIQRDEVSLNRKNFRLKAEAEATARFLQKISSDDDLDETDAETVRESYEKEVNHIDGHKKKLGALEETMQDMSKRQVLEKYGDGLYFVKFELDFSAFKELKHEDRFERYSSFTVRLAPLNIMPHTVHLFLEQVSQGLWNGCSFMINADHLVKAAPLPMSGDLDKITPFVEADLAAPSFPEYSDEFPHKKFTLGFVGKANAHGFFINTRDNSDHHGQDSQLHHETGGGDPCFGEVVSGYKAILRLSSVPTVDQIFMKTPVGITSAKIVEGSGRGDRSQ